MLRALALYRTGLHVAKRMQVGLLIETLVPGRAWFVFFFSSRRRHTRLQGDWSSDVCSSDLQHCFKLWSDSADTQLATLCRGLLYRRLYKTIDLSHLDPAAARAVFARAKSAVEDRKSVV